MKYAALVMILMVNGLFAQDLSSLNMNLIRSLSEGAAFFSIEEFLNQETSFDNGNFIYSGCCNVGPCEIELTREIKLEWDCVKKKISLELNNKAAINTIDLSGSLFDAESGTELLFVSIGVFQNSEAITGTETDFDGKFTLKSLRPGEYTFVVSYVGYIEHRIKLIIEQDLGVQYQKEGLESSFKFLSIAQCSEIEKVHAEIERSADIIGELRDYRTNEPIIAGTVILEKDGEKTLESISDINGNFSFSQVKLGNYIIRAEYFGYHHYHKEVQLSLSDQTVIHQSKNIVKHDIVIADVLAVHEGILSFDDLSSIGAIESKSSNFNCLGVVVMECGMKGPSKSNLSGVVTFKNTKEAAIFANITLEQQGKMVHGVVSDEEGNFDFFNVVQGTHTLRASYVGYEDYVKEIKLKGDLNIKIEFEEGLELPSIVILGKQMIIQRCGPICGNTITEDSPFIDRFEQNDRHVKYNDSKISFFPNPASDQVHIVVGEEIETIIITSIIGQVMYRESSPNPGEKIINLYDYKNGTYFISVVKNGEILTEPLIVVGY